MDGSLANLMFGQREKREAPKKSAVTPNGNVTPLRTRCGLSEVLLEGYKIRLFARLYLSSINLR